MILVPEDAYIRLHKALRTMRETCDAAIASGDLLEKDRALRETFMYLNSLLELLDCP